MRWLTAAAALCLLGCAAPRDDVAAIQAVSDARAEAFRRGDAAAIAARFTNDGLLMAPGVPAARGREAVRAYYQKLFDEFEADLESGYDEVEVSGDLAFGRGFAKVTVRPRHGGEAQSSTAKYINILRRQPNGEWLTTHDIWNGNEP
ncbi:MAG: SgcJ/EcaC family oxidoreductase [Bryobacteraceae bacterium]|nr:SgcJ/EcaC family oxidoreductase [Bryobacteraceae bacterium]